MLLGNFSLQFYPNSFIEKKEQNENNVQDYFSPETEDDVWSITVCDDDYDGITNFSFDDIRSQLNEEFQETRNEEDLVYIANSYNGLIKIENVSTNPNRVFVCNYSQSLYEVAVDQNKDVYVSTRNGLYRVDVDNCNYTFVGQIPDNSNIAMSFDTRNNLYVGGFHSKVYRADAGQFQNYYEWHDFGVGSSGGDFVVIGEFMYIAWAINDDYYLYKVTIDNDNQYVSHENLGLIITDTFGLAAENGILYGVTPDYLYSIDLPSLNTQRIITNTTSTPWWGAAGLHEAISYDFSFHISHQDAQTGNDPLDSNFSNTIPYHQPVYIRIYNETTDETEVITLELNVITPPETTAANLYECSVGNEVTYYDLTDAIPVMIDDTTGIQISYHETQEHAENNSNPIQTPENYGIQSDNYVVYVRFANGDCVSYNTITLQKDAQTLDLGSDISICENDSVTIGTNSVFESYEWTGLQGDDLLNNDSSASHITVTQPGTYQLTVSYGAGCTLTEEITIVSEDLPIFVDQTLTYCSDSSTLSINSSQIISDLNQLNPDFHYTLFYSEEDAQNSSHAISGNLSLNNNQDLIVKVKNNSNSTCFSLNEVNIQIEPTPEFEWQEQFSMCLGESIQISVPNHFDSYQWSGLQGEDLTQNNVHSNEVLITQAGVYTLEVTNNLCSTSKQVVVTYEDAAIIQEVQIQGNDANIIATGNGPFEYSLDGINWSSSPYMNNLDFGEHTAYVRGENVCGITELNFAIFSFSNVITPNNDGYNDYWYVKGLDAYPGSRVQIYNRYGKLLLDQEIQSEFRWDGTYNGSVLSSGSYWYIIQITDGRSYSGHITVKNIR